MSRWDCDDYIDSLLENLKKDIYLSIAFTFLPKLENIEHIDEKRLDKYLERRGYVVNYVSGNKIWIKHFTCVQVHSKSCIDIWTDIPRHGIVRLEKSILTGLEVALNYFEKL